MHLISRNLLRLLCSFAIAAVVAAQTPSEVLFGTWDGTYEPPGTVGGDPFSLVIDSVEGDAVRGTMVFPYGDARFVGTLASDRGSLALATEEQDPLRAELTLAGGKLAGQGRKGTLAWSFHVARVSTEVQARSHAPRVVDLSSTERPETFSLIGLPDELGLKLDELRHEFVTRNRVVGLSIACVVDGELADVRSSGWEDFFANVPASDETRYRWASISKPLTATAIARLVARGAFDLDRDVRALVPEFPAKEVDGKPAVVRPRDILRHQSGIVHYEGAQRTWRAYDQTYPFEQLVHGLDLFAESPLLFTPGTRESYSTHAWTLLGLVLERSAQKPYADVVRELVLEPCGMTSTEPDRPSRAIPHRAKGYEVADDDHMVEVFEDDVSWKLPGGGWISTVGDLARFGAALTSERLLDDERKRLFWTKQTTADGTETSLGLGFFLGALDGERVVYHSGGQRKASTFLAILPEHGLACAVMSNTESAPTELLAKQVLRLLWEEQR